MSFACLLTINGDRSNICVASFNGTTSKVAGAVKDSKPRPVKSSSPVTTQSAASTRKSQARLSHSTARASKISFSSSSDAMKEGGDQLPTTVASAVAWKKEGSSAADLFGKSRYKFWALAAIILLAFWSMLTGTVSLRSSASSLHDDLLDLPLHDDLDVIEIEEREKVVRHMWDVYTHGRRARLPRFWQEAFEAAYEELASDDADARDAAIAEIARMSARMLDLEQPPPSTSITTHHPKTAEGDESQIYGSTKAKVKLLTLTAGEAQ